METERKDTTVVDYRTAFSSDAGKRVLADILVESGLFDSDLKTPEELAVENFAKIILRNLGLSSRTESEHGWMSVNNVSSFVQKLLELQSQV